MWGGRLLFKKKKKNTFVCVQSLIYTIKQPPLVTCSRSPARPRCLSHSLASVSSAPTVRSFLKWQYIIIIIIMSIHNKSVRVICVPRFLSVDESWVQTGFWGRNLDLIRCSLVVLAGVFRGAGSLPLAPLAPVLGREVKAFRIDAQVSLLHCSFVSVHDVLWQSQDVLTLRSTQTLWSVAFTKFTMCATAWVHQHFTVGLYWCDTDTAALNISQYRYQYNVISVWIKTYFHYFVVWKC